MATLNQTDLEFILQQILMAESGQGAVDPHLAFGLRTVMGIDNNLVPGQSTYGSADQAFGRVGSAVFLTPVNDALLNAANLAFQGSLPFPTATTYQVTNSSTYVVDAAPRLISNLISDQSTANQAAVDAANAFAAQLGDGYTAMNTTPGLGTTGPTVDSQNLFIGNVTPDAGLSAPFNTWMTLFGQFFDHGLDLVAKGGDGKVYIPLAEDDPLYVVGGHSNFMVLTRATTTTGPGADGILGTADDDTHANTNGITPFVDQSQTYSSHPSVQVFLREYATGFDGQLHSTGRLLTPAGGGMATWKDIKENALKLGITLTDKFVGNVPLLAADDYGNYIRGAHGFVQVVAERADHTTFLVEGTAAGLNLDTLKDSNGVAGTLVGSGHQFLNDINDFANPFTASGAPIAADADLVADLAADAAIPRDARGNLTAYDNELLDAHYVAGDGRANENIGLTAVHDIFHSEHNRQIAMIKELVQTAIDDGNTSFAADWLLPGAFDTIAVGVGAGRHLVSNYDRDEDGKVDDAAWNGERLFQAAKFATETQYQHLVFEEFARKIAPTIHLFGNNDIHLDPAITAEFAHAVYRFGHSMLDQNLPRYELNVDGTMKIGADGKPVLNNIGLLQAFLNPLEFAKDGATAQIVAGTTHQIGNEIDEFVTGTLRNNLLGLPLDLGALNIARGRDTGIPTLNLLRAELFEKTGDTSLKQYDSWSEFGQFLKHDGSLINFIAAYGDHVSVLSAMNMADKRAAALALVTQGLDPLSASVTADPTAKDAYNFMHSLGSYANDVTDARAVHSVDGSVPLHSTGSVTGLDRIDLWIGGLAEKQNLFGGLLGSTFNFIFETQLENLQDGDRLYYLPRIEGTHWGTEIEANSFAEMIMNNTGVKGLPASIFLTPEYTVEAADAIAHMDDPANLLHNPVSGKQLVEVIEVAGLNGTTHHQVVFLGDDNFFGNTMVMDGTSGDDDLRAGQADDDTVWGLAGNDTLDGGNGNDFVYGGVGNDSITDSAGDDVLHGDAGNDIINAGIGDDLVFGGDGDDHLIGSFGLDAINGGQGNDLIEGGEDDDELVGDEGDDWIDGGLGGDLMVGDHGAPTGQVPLISGNDVLDGGAGGDRMQGFSGDDIMLGLGGFDKFEGRLGYDWAVFEQETHGVDVDMERKELIAGVPGGDAVRDNFLETEGLSGSKFDDILSGTIDSKLDPLNQLENFNLIDGLLAKFDFDADGNMVTHDETHSFFMPGAAPFSGGNIILGGGGSDTIIGRGGNDIIDGDAWLHVSKTWSAADGLQITRKIEWVTSNPLNEIDVAVFSGNRSQYDVSYVNFLPDGTFDPRGFIQVTHLGANGTGVGADGVDLLRNIERLQFADEIEAVDLFGGNQVPTGKPAITAARVAGVGVTLHAGIGSVGDGDFGNFLDADPTIAAIDPAITKIAYQWQWQDPARGLWVDVAGGNTADFTPGTFFEGKPVRVVLFYTDSNGYREHVASDATAALVPALINTAPFIVPQAALNGVPNTAATQGVNWSYTVHLSTIFSDAQTPTALTYTAWTNVGGVLTQIDTVNSVNGLKFKLITDATGAVTDGMFFGNITNFGNMTITVKATDPGGLSVTDPFTIAVAKQTNHAPTANADAVSTNEDTSLTIQAATLLGNDTDADGNTLRVVLDQSSLGAGGRTAHGSIVQTLSGSLIYTPDADYNGTDSFQYFANDGLVNSATAATVTITVNAVNDAPVNTVQGAATDENTAVAINGLSVSDIDGTAPVGAQPYTVTLTVTGGTLSVTGIPGVTLGGNGTGAVTLTGTLAGINTALAANGAVMFTPIANDPGLAPVTPDHVAHVTLTMATNDGGNVGSGPVGGLTATDTAVIDVTLVDSAAKAGLTITSKDANNVVGRDQVGSTLSAVLGADPDGAIVSRTIHWFKATATGPVEIGVGDSYTLQLADVGTSIFARADYVDAQQFHDTSLDSNSIGPVGRVFTGTNPLRGNGGNDSLVGTLGNDLMSGLAGNDTLVGGLGADIMIGGIGNDTYGVDSRFDVVIEDLNAGTDTIVVTNLENPTLAFTLAANVENLTFQNSALNFNGVGNGLANVIVGSGGADTLDGAGGSDSLSGAGGDDSLVGGIGNDTIDGGTGNDTIDGGTGSDFLTGGTGNDLFLHITAADTVVGGTGLDTISLDGAANGITAFDLTGTGVETLVFTGTGGLFVTGDNNGTVAETITGNTGNDTILANAGADSVSGGGGADSLGGGSGNDTLDGGTGNDILNGGTGDNVLIGGAGNDTYTLNNSNNNSDTLVFSPNSATPGSGWSVETVFNFDGASQNGQDFIEMRGFAADITNWITIAAPANNGDVVITVNADHSLPVNGSVLTDGDMQIVLKSNGFVAPTANNINSVTANVITLADFHFLP